MPRLPALQLALWPLVATGTPPPAAEAATDWALGRRAVVAQPFIVVPVMHGTATFSVNGKTWWLDPWSKAPLEGAPRADVVLITDIHGDHLDPAGLSAVGADQAVVVAPQAVADEWEGQVDHVLANGASVEVEGVTITAVPMYNLVRGPSEGALFHDKGRGNGYLLEAEGTRIYFAGDTECTEEMKALQDIDLAFVPMNLPYTMPPAEAAGCVAAFKPDVVVPYHYRGSDLSELEAALEGVEGLRIQREDWYPAPKP